MNRLRKFLYLKSNDRCLLINVGLLVILIRLGLALLSFKTLWCFLVRIAQKPNWLLCNQLSPDRIVWAVKTISRYVPKTKTCLIQALATQILLKQRGFPAKIHIGVTKSEKGKLEAHAWIESQGRIIIGGENLSRYIPLLVL